MKKENQETIQYDFGEKKEEYHASKQTNLPVWQSPRYIQSKQKAIELIASKKYDLDCGDFWILMNATKSGKMMYNGLIISHNGCLKINDKLDPNMKFKPSCVSFVKDTGDKIKVMQYINEEQGIYEFGEISPENCKNDYPYAMVLKRLMDRVILKNSKVGFYGIYSDSESEDFKEKENENNNSNNNNSNLFKSETGPMAKLAEQADNDLKEQRKIRVAQNVAEKRKKAETKFAEMKKRIEECGSFSEVEGYLESEQKAIDYFKEWQNDLFLKLQEVKEAMKALLE